MIPGTRLQLLQATAKAKLANAALMEAKQGVGAAIGNTGCFIAGTPVWVALPRLVSVADHRTASAVDAALDSTQTTIPIEDVLLGHRVPARNPTSKEAFAIPLRPDCNGWKVIRMEVRHRNGSIVDVELLRSAEWIARNRLQVGVVIDLRLTEIDVHASGHVMSIGDGPQIPPGEGAVVTGRFVTREGTGLVRVTFEDATQLVGTANHPMWSPLEWEWRGLGEFKSGQFVKTRAGLVAVASTEELQDREPLFNIEVDGEHVYEVTALGVLAHNNDLLCELLRLQAAANKGPLQEAQAVRLAQLEAQKLANPAAFAGKIVVLGSGDLVVDANAAIALQKAAQFPGKTLDELVASGVLQPHEAASLKTLQSSGKTLRLTETAAAEANSGLDQIILTADRNSAEYKSVLNALEKANVGGGKGINDRTILADIFFAKTDAGVTPVFATQDKQVLNRLYSLSGKDPTKLGGKTVAVAVPNGFNVTIDGRTITVIPLPVK